MTEKQLAILIHSLGLNTAIKPYRNHFVAGTGHSDLPDLEELKKQGMMEKCNSLPKYFSDETIIFQVTPAGKEYAMKNRPRRKLSRGKKKYFHWLQISDSFPDLSFSEVIKNPEYRDLLRSLGKEPFMCQGMLVE